MKNRHAKLSKAEKGMMFDLFDRIETVLSLDGGSQENLSDFDFRFRMHLKDVLEDVSKRPEKPLSRSDIAASMTKLLGRKIVKDHLDQWIALSAIQKRIHVDALKALCDVIGDHRPLNFFVEACGFVMLTPDEAVYAEYGSKMLMKRMIEDDIKETTSKARMESLRAKMKHRIKGGI